MIGCDHTKVYAPYALMSNPPIYLWICSRCGKEGKEKGESVDGSRYEEIRKLFADKRREME